MTTTDLAADVRARAATCEHPWDRAAVEWPLTPQSTVIDVGGYQGRWALQIAQRYGARLYVFEPQLWAADVCKEVLAPYNATVLPYGLGIADEVIPLFGYETDGCTFIPIGSRAIGVGQLREISTEFRQLGIDQIDLMLVNIEGYEYTLLPYMLDNTILPQRLMVQWHRFADGGGWEPALRRRMLRHYRKAGDYGAVLTAWERR